MSKKDLNGSPLQISSWKNEDTPFKGPIMCVENFQPRFNSALTRLHPPLWGGQGGVFNVHQNLSLQFLYGGGSGR